MAYIILANIIEIYQITLELLRPAMKETRPY